METPPRRWIPMPLDWARGRICRQLWTANPAHVARFLWLVNQAHLVNRAGAVELANGQALSPEDCATETDRDPAGWRACFELLEQLEQLHVDDGGPQLLCWPEWRLDAHGSEPGRRWIPMPLDWARGRVCRQLREADPAHVARFLWLINQAHQVALGGVVSLWDGVAMSPADCAAETDQDIAGWESCASLLVDLEQLDVDVGMRLLCWPSWHLDPREQRPAANSGAAAVATTPMPTTAQAARAPLRKGSRRSKLTPEERRESNRIRQANFRANRSGVTPIDDRNANVTRNAKKVTLSEDRNASGENVTLMTPNVTLVTPLHEHADQDPDRHEHEDSSIIIKDSSSQLEPCRPEPRPPQESDDVGRLFCREFWEQWGGVIDVGFRALMGRRLVETDCAFATRKLAEKNGSAWAGTDPETRAYALRWACEQLRAMLASGKQVSESAWWPYACTLAGGHVEQIELERRQNAFMASRGRSTRPLLYIAPSSKLQAVG